jgi:DNA-binding NtrC family response regulator
MASQHGVDARSKRVLIVEDELMIRMLLEDMLAELGYAVAGTAARLDEAMNAVASGNFDIAILDVNLDGQAVSPVAEALVARGMPFFFVTGYAERGLPEHYRDRPMLKKPFRIDSLRCILDQVLET